MMNILMLSISMRVPFCLTEINKCRLMSSVILTSKAYNFPQTLQFLLGMDMVRFGMKTEPNQTELFAKFKITELNWTVYISNWIELFQTELNCFELNCYYWYSWKKKTKLNFSYRTELNCFKSNWTISN